MKLRGVALVAVTVAVCAASAPAVHGQMSGHDRPEIVPIKKLAGSTAGEILGQWWAQVLAIAEAENPLMQPNSGRCLLLGRRGNVASAAQNGPVATTCTIEVQTPIFLPATLNFCTSAEPDNLPTEEEQRACAATIFDIEEITAILVSIDGGPSVDIHDERFQVISPQMPVVFPEGAIFGLQAGPATFVGAGYAATTRKPLRPGRHTVTYEFVLNDGTSVIASLHLDVVRKHRGKGTGPDR